MNLASPADPVEPADALPPEAPEQAIAPRATSAEAATAEPPSTVDAAVTYEDSMRYAPANVVNVALENQRSPASVEALRQTGVELETYAGIICERPERNCLQILLPCLYGGNVFVAFGEVKKYLVIKGGECFVYGEAQDPSPLYTFSLSDVYVLVAHPSRPSAETYVVDPMPPNNLSNPKLRTLMLRYKSDGSYAYQVIFYVDKDDEVVVDNFCKAVERASGRVPATAVLVASEDSKKI